MWVLRAGANEFLFFVIKMLMTIYCLYQIEHETLTDTIKSIHFWQESVADSYHCLYVPVEDDVIVHYPIFNKRKMLSNPSSTTIRTTCSSCCFFPSAPCHH